MRQKLPMSLIHEGVGEVVYDPKGCLLYTSANELLKNIKSGKISKVNIENELNKIESIKTEDINIVVEEKIDARASVKVKLTDDIYRYDAGKNNHLTYINGKGFSQYIYLTKDGRYAFTPSSWMEKAGLTVTMPTKSNGCLLYTSRCV